MRDSLACHECGSPGLIFALPLPALDACFSAGASPASSSSADSDPDFSASSLPDSPASPASAASLLPAADAPDGAACGEAARGVSAAAALELRLRLPLASAGDAAASDMLRVVERDELKRAQLFRRGMWGWEGMIAPAKRGGAARVHGGEACRAGAGNDSVGALPTPAASTTPCPGVGGVQLRARWRSRSSLHPTPTAPVSYHVCSSTPHRHRRRRHHRRVDAALSRRRPRAPGAGKHAAAPRGCATCGQRRQRKERRISCARLARRRYCQPGGPELRPARRARPRRGPPLGMARGRGEWRARRRRGSWARQDIRTA